MIHILLNLIADKILGFIINFHIVGIAFHKGLGPVIHTGHQNPAPFSLIHADSTGIWQSLTGAFLGNGLTAFRIRYGIIQWNLFNKEIYLSGRNDNAGVRLQFFLFSQKGDRLIMPAVIQSHLGLIIGRNNGPGLILVLFNDVREAGSGPVCHIPGIISRGFQKPALKKSRQHGRTDCKGHQISPKSHFFRPEKQTDNPIQQQNRNPTQKIRIINTAPCSIHQRRQAKSSRTQKNCQDYHTEAERHEHGPMFSGSDDKKQETQCYHGCKNAKHHITGQIAVYRQNKFPDPLCHNHNDIF